jgi:putative aldouronate transport system permease protein
VGLFYAVTFWNQFQHPLMFIQNTDLFPLQLKVRQLISGGSEILNISMVSNVNYTESTLSAATVVFAIIPIVAIYPRLQKHFAQGAMLGSVKG